VDFSFEYQDVEFVWDVEKAKGNEAKHGITFESAATVFFDPFAKVTDATDNDEQRDAVIGFDSAARLLFVVHTQQEDDCIRIISARRATRDEENFYAN
jgi:uncharacterized protein